MAPQAQVIAGIVLATRVFRELAELHAVETARVAAMAAEEAGIAAEVAHLETIRGEQEMRLMRMEMELVACQRRARMYRSYGTHRAPGPTAHMGPGCTGPSARRRVCHSVVSRPPRPFFSRTLVRTL